MPPEERLYSTYTEDANGDLFIEALNNSSLYRLALRCMLIYRLPYCCAHPLHQICSLLITIQGYHDPKSPKQSIEHDSCGAQYLT